MRTQTARRALRPPMPRTRFVFHAEDGIRGGHVTGVQTCALPIYPYGNSVGHLVLHMTGNLNYYIGARVAGTGYVRDRDREFTDGQPPRKDEALGAFDRTIARSEERRVEKERYSEKETAEMQKDMK